MHWLNCLHPVHMGSLSPITSPTEDPQDI